MTPTEKPSVHVEGAPVRWGVIGTSGWAGRTFAPAIKSAGGILVGAAGSKPQGSEEFARSHGAPETYRSVDDLLDDKSIEAVWIASPTDLHEAHGLRALEAGKHVLMEKPLAPNVRAGEAMVEATTRHPRQISAIGFQHRFNPAHRRLRELCRGGELGELTMLRFHQFAVPPAPPTTTWRSAPERSGGWAVNDLGSHLVDLMQFVAGEASSATGILTSARYRLPVDDTATILLRIGESVGVVDVAMGTPGGKSRLEVYGSDGFAVVGDSWPGGGLVSLNDGERQEPFEVVDTYARQAQAFGAAVRGGPWEGAIWADGLAVARLIDAVAASGT
jgi:1,5-anhydro-D-fructose reductase (1,5-anhydro-D-mannitol-forming)